MSVRVVIAATGKKRSRSQVEQDEPPVSSATTAKKPRTAKAAAPKLAVTTNSTTSRKAQTPASAAAKKVVAKQQQEEEEIADSEEERVKQQQQQQQQPPPPKKIANTKNGKASVYDFPDSGEDELSSAEVTTSRQPVQRQSRATTKPAVVTAAPAAAVVPSEPEKKKRGRPSKQPVVEPPKKTSAPEKVTLEESNDENDVAAAVVVSKAGRRVKATAKAVGLRGGDAQLLPKGILTPRKRDGVQRRQKSVAFEKSGGDIEEDEEEEEDEQPTPTRSSKKVREPSAEDMEVDEEPPAEVEEAEDKEEEEEEEEDEEVCAICSNPDSKRGNQIIFCDSCDMAVHQKCYGVPRVPKGDWFCRKCTEEGAAVAAKSKQLAVAPAQQQQKTLTYTTVTAPPPKEQIPDIPNFAEHLRSAQRVLLDRCTGRRRIKLRGQDEAYDKAYRLVEQTIVAGEGNSMMIIGARGCGKTTLVESILTNVAQQHKEEFHVVRLNGFIHTDDRLALREIWRQLGKEMAVEDDVVNKTTNYADTMASLLALLSHPSEIAEQHDGGITSKSIVFVIDEFDLFATHARQTLLYNLFDIAQARKAPIAVLGLTTRIDVVESLEKRVKSRFSHRYIYLSLPKSLPAFWDVCKQGLSIDEEDMEAEGIELGLKGHDAFWKWWNERIETLYKDSRFLDCLETQFYTTKSVSAFLTSCVLPLASLSPTSPTLRIPGPSVSGLNVSLEPPDSKLHMLESLSDLDLSLLIAAARFDIVAHTDTVNFAMAYDEYTSLMGKQRVQNASSGMLAMGGRTRVWGRGVAGMAWERLVALGVLIPAASGGRGTAGLGGLESKMWKVDVALEEIPAAVKLNAVLGRWCKEI
ncbi:putative origin recognition complex subunit 4 [Podospora australis]|uniref:Origin recognition complex subunit 4 n=1 Tax=Podospora australis TaxID=1536484 RepID=A0AAN6X495_9PEZI|nr:putative origin recognition complex subunit 4 [Podospora australis]